MVCESWRDKILMPEVTDSVNKVYRYEKGDAQSGDESNEKEIQLRYDISLGNHATRSAW
jgi:hypothetical protein